MVYLYEVCAGSNRTQLAPSSVRSSFFFIECEWVDSTCLSDTVFWPWDAALNPRKVTTSCPNRQIRASEIEADTKVEEYLLRIAGIAQCPRDGTEFGVKAILQAESVDVTSTVQV